MKVLYHAGCDDGFGALSLQALKEQNQEFLAALEAEDLRESDIPVQEVPIFRELLDSDVGSVTLCDAGFYEEKFGPER